nr:MAG TPA: hypothetical protein [Caudoviricetes sp.]
MCHLVTSLVYVTDRYLSIKKVTKSSIVFYVNHSNNMLLYFYRRWHYVSY